MQHAPLRPLNEAILRANYANYAQLITVFTSIDQNLTISRRYRPQATRTLPLCIVIAGTASVILAQGPNPPTKNKRRFVGRIEAAFGSISDKTDFMTAQAMSQTTPGYQPFVFVDLSEDPAQNVLIYRRAVLTPPCLLWSGTLLQICAVEWDIQLARRIRLAAAWCHAPDGQVRNVSERTKEEIRGDFRFCEAIDVVMHVARTRRQEGWLMFPTRPPSGLYTDEVLLKKEDVEYLNAAWDAIYPRRLQFFGWDGLQRI